MKRLKEQVIISLKMAVGVIVATLLAKSLGLDFYNTVTTIVIVTILSAKKQSIKLSATLILAAIYSLGLASLLFTVFGFSLGIFGVYIFTFVLTMYIFDTTSAIITNVVLVMQIYLLGEVSISIFLNQFILMFLGLSVALIFNLITLDIESELIEYQKMVEDLFKSIFLNMGRCLNDECQSENLERELKELDGLLSKGRTRSYVYLNSFYFEQNNYYIEYFIMRRQQYNIVLTMQEFIKLSFLNRTEVKLLRGFTDNLSDDSLLINTCEIQMKQLNEIEYHFTHIAEIPATKKQLQNRIALHRYLYGLLNLVEFKMDFVNTFSKDE